ncbi:MAG TPA: hypothetical protein VKU77_01305 [Streptosporangiaceae bacterium]|nr:hypothetical protein [Streptosporangiaceae bacterium]
MTRRVEFADGSWAELRDARGLSGADQETYWDSIDELAEANPDGEVTRKDLRRIRDAVLGRFITAWSYPYPLPFSTEVRMQLPVETLNVLYEAIRPVTDLLSGQVAPDPKTGTDSSGTSPATSPASADAPPEEQADGPSATP